MNITRNGERRSIASPTTMSLFFKVLGLETKSLLTQKFLQQKKRGKSKREENLSAIMQTIHVVKYSREIEHTDQTCFAECTNLRSTQGS